MAPTTDASAVLVVVDPTGRRHRAALAGFPFRIGRAADNHLVLRDSRVSRNHAQILFDGCQFVIEDLSSLHGVWVNGERVGVRRPLEGSESIEFGVPDGYRLHFTRSRDELQKLLARPLPSDSSRSGGANLEKLRAVLEVARSLQSSFSVDDVLNTLVDAALAVTGAERGFLLLFDAAHELQTRSARSRGGRDLPASDLRVPCRLIQQALEGRRDLFYMSFDPAALECAPGNTISVLELRSVACIPLVRVNLRKADAQSLPDTAASLGVLYMDSRGGSVDLAGGNRELLQTLAIEASTVLENARLLEEERIRQRIEEELAVARRIQQSLLPATLPDAGWFRICGSSEASHQVGGDYFDVAQKSAGCWSLVVADVAGKGVSSALMASFLQGAFLSASGSEPIPELMARINAFLFERAEYGKYATMFYAMLDRAGTLTWANAAQCTPYLLRKDGAIEPLESTSRPLGLLSEGDFPARQQHLRAGDRLIIYSDGVTEAQNEAGEFFGRKRLRAVIQSVIAESCAAMLTGIREAVAEFTAGAEPDDDITVVVVEYQG
jgi:serine phosphatase RsbU (regulator of sigma subunit)